MSESTHTPIGHDHGNTHSPIYQGLVATRCYQCPKTHKIMFTSDEEDAVKVQVEHMLRVMRDLGYSPASIICTSYHPGTDLNMREWEQVERMMDAAETEDIPF